MDISTPKINRMLWAICGTAFAMPSLFFTYFTVLLIYVNLTASAADAAAHRTGGMPIGAIAFPLAAVIFGVIIWFFFRRELRSERSA